MSKAFFGSVLRGYCSQIPGLCTALCPRLSPMKRFVKCFFELLTQALVCTAGKGAQNAPVDV